MSQTGIIDIVVIEGAVNGEVFFKFIDGLLMEMNQFPEKNSVIVMDNVQFHVDVDIQDYVEAK